MAEVSGTFLCIIMHSLFLQRIPRPVTAEQMLEDLKSAPQNDIVFTSSPSGKARDKGH